MRDDGYLEKILTAKVYDVAIESPLDRASNLSTRLKNEVFLKREDTQHGGKKQECPSDGHSSLTS